MSGRTVAAHIGLLAVDPFLQLLNALQMIEPSGDEHFRKTSKGAQILDGEGS
jgi:hypothetical protein